MTTLECGDCNSKIGSKYESHVANMREAIAWAHREVGTERLVRFKANDKSSAAIISYEEGPTAMIKATNSADPNYQAVTEVFEAHAANPNKLKMGYSFDIRSALNNRVLSAVHAAFLMMGSSLNSVGKGITIYHNPRSNKSLCQSLRKNSSG